MLAYLRRWFLLFPALIAIVVSACGGQRELPVPDLHRVRGKLTIRGEPARYVAITLEPQFGGYGLAAEAITSHDGTFELRTLSNDQPDGAAVGEYEVVLEQGSLPPDAPEGVAPTVFAGEFRPGIMVKVEKGDNTLEIDVP
jgi:hypothetical protein